MTYFAGAKKEAQEKRTPQKIMIRIRVVPLKEIPILKAFAEKIAPGEPVGTNKLEQDTRAKMPAKPPLS